MNTATTQKITAKQLVVTARELNVNEPGECDSYTFYCWELPNGMVWIQSETTNDWFFDSRDEIEPNGLASTESVEETGETKEFLLKDLESGIHGSIREYGEDSVNLDLIRQLLPEFKV